MKSIFYTILYCFLILNSVNSQVLDSSFAVNGKRFFDGFNELAEVSSALLQPNGKVLVGGYDYDENFYFPSINVWRINNNGSLDRTFGSGGMVHIAGSPFGGSEYGGELALQSDNKIVGLGTDFDRDGLTKDQILLFRLKPNGNLDSAFGINGKTFINFGGFTNIGKALAIRPDKKIVVTGVLYTNRSGSERIELAQFLPNGKIDSSFGINGTATSGLEFQQQGLAVTVLPDNKIIAGFLFVKNNIYNTCLIRYNANGTIDNSFGNNGIVINKNSGGNSTGAMSLAVQPDGKIVEYTTSANNNILYRYNANGSIDNSFGTNGYVNVPACTYVSLSVVLDNNQRILINTPDFAMLRYLPDGTLDSSFGIDGKLSTDFTEFYPGSYPRSEQIVVTPDSKILPVGYLDEGDGITDFVIARFKNEEAITSRRINKIAVAVYPNPATSTLNVKELNPAKKYSLTIVDAKGNIKALKQVENATTFSLNIQMLKTGNYYLNIVSGGAISTLPFLKE